MLASPFESVKRQAVLGALRSAGTQDPDLLDLVKHRIVSRVRIPKLIGVGLVIVGALVTTTVTLAPIGVLICLVGLALRHIGVRNIGLVESIFADFVRNPSERKEAVSTARSAALASVLCALALSALVPVAIAQTPPPAPAPKPCDGQVSCTAVREFSAVTTSFKQTTVDVRTKSIAVTVRFTNLTPKPLILGYVATSGVITDDRGNRYVVPSAASIRGIGEIQGNTFDGKFTLEPGEWSDARFEYVLRMTSGLILGTTYEMEMAVREIDRLPGEQFRLGKEHAIRWERAGIMNVAAGITLPPVAGTPAGSAGAAVPAEPAPAAAPPPPPVDNCLGKSRCYDAGSFSVEVNRLTGSIVGGRHHVITFTVRIRNVSAQQLILGYKHGSNTGTDDLGNRYYYGRAGTVDGSVKGIGYVTSRSADPQFALRPGQSRDVNVSLIRYEAARKPIGTQFSWDVALMELEILPSRQIREVREFAVGVSGLSEGPASLLSKLIKP